jgi:ATP-binding cassette subfamily B protein
MTSIAAQHQEDEFQSRLDFGLWRRVFTHALAYKGHLSALAIAAVTIAAMDVSFPLVTGSAVDEVMAMGSDVRLWLYALVYLGLTIGLAGGVWVFIIMAGGISNRVAHDIRTASFARLQELEFSFYDKRPIGWLISRMTSDCDKLSRIISWGFLDLVWALCLVLLITIALLVTNWKLGLVLLSVVPPLIVISAVFQKRLLLSARETRKYNSFITGSFNESIQGMRTSKTLVREEENLKEFEELSAGMYGASVRNALQSAVYMPIVLTLGALATGLVLWKGGVDVTVGSVTIGTLMKFIMFAGMFFDPINQIARVLIQLQGAQAAGERVIGLLDTVPAIRDSSEVLDRIEETSHSALPSGTAIDGLPDTIDEIEFKHVDFAYDNGQTVLEDFNLTVRAGQMIALVGPSGGGKSTIVNLASRFYEPTGGEILINGIDYRKRSLAWLQGALGIVLQTPHLFSGSIRENIRYGRLDASDQEIEAIARLVNAHDFILKHEHGYETDVGEGGNRLSTGQKQLVSFARALLSNPQIFIMDEATSSIDTATEQLIQESLHTMFTGRISFVIAHRLSTIRSADRILVINHGKIEENGRHEELIEKRGHYYELYTNQFRREREEELIGSRK